MNIKTLRNALFGLILFSSTATLVACGSSNNTLIPELRAVVTPEPFGRNSSAISLLAEAGARNLRAGATLALYATPQQRFKVSAELLTQKLKHHFHQAYHKKWVYQYALGGEYEYLFRDCFVKSVSAGLAFSHAYRKSFCSSTVTPNTLVQKRLSDSDGTYTYLDTTVGLWQSAEIKFGVNYDTIRYHRHYQSSRHRRGFGGNAQFIQKFCNDFCLNLTAEIRKPFNFFGGIVNWYHNVGCGTLNIGLYGSYTKGKFGSPNAYTAGLQLGFAFGQGSCCLTPAPTCGDNWRCDVRPDVSCYAQKPAVYMPVVLNIRDTQLVQMIEPG